MKVTLVFKIAAAAIAAAIFLSCSSAAHADPLVDQITGRTTTTMAPGSPDTPLPDVRPVDSSPGMFDVSGKVRQAIDDWISSLVESAINPALDLLGRTLLSAPDVTNHPGVHASWVITLVIANSLFVLLAIVGGILVMTHETIQTRYSVKEIAPRLVIAVITANCSALIASQAIAFSNALAQGILGDGVTPSDAVGGLGRAIVANIGTGGFLVIMAAVATVFCLLLACLYLLRAMLVVILVVAAPLMLACHALPQTEGLAMIWWRASAACLGVQVGQALVLVISVRVFFAPDGSNVVGLSATNGLINLLITLCLFWIMLRIPIWAGKLVMNRRSSIYVANKRPSIALKVLKAVK